VIAESRLYAADLIGADLSNATLIRATLSNATLFRAALSNAIVRIRGAVQVAPQQGGANLRGATLMYTTLSDADLHGARNLTQPQLDLACGTDAKLPPGLALAPC